jgi:hypothetical protein
MKQMIQLRGSTIELGLLLVSCVLSLVNAERPASSSSVLVSLGLRSGGQGQKMRATEVSQHNATAPYGLFENTLAKLDARLDAYQTLLNKVKAGDTDNVRGLARAALEQSECYHKLMPKSLEGTTNYQKGIETIREQALSEHQQATSDIRRSLQKILQDHAMPGSVPAEFDFKRAPTWGIDVTPPSAPKDHQREKESPQEEELSTSKEDDRKYWAQLMECFKTSGMPYTPVEDEYIHNIAKRGRHGDDSGRSNGIQNAAIHVHRRKVFDSQAAIQETEELSKATENLNKEKGEQQDTITKLSSEKGDLERKKNGPFGCDERNPGYGRQACR